MRQQVFEHRSATAAWPALDRLVVQRGTEWPEHVNSQPRRATRRNTVICTISRGRIAVTYSCLGWFGYDDWRILNIRAPM